MVEGVRALRHQPVDRGRELFLLERCGHALVDTGPQRLEHQCRVERRHDDDDTHVGMLLAEAGKRQRQVVLFSDIDEEDVEVVKTWRVWLGEVNLSRGCPACAE